ncbi:MAG TPA: hypothetical protein PKD53_29235, partial [Chloroflexaceae bacterium]|nr:hypothetical protein [Chloroflexaceae bacterium]
MRSAPRPLPRLLAPLGLLLALLLPALAPAPQARAAAFAEGNVVVYRVGDGSAPLADSGNPVFLDEFTPAGALVQSLPMPTTAGEGSWPLFASTRADEGLITRSADGRSLIVTGYGRRDTAFLPSSSAMSYRRVIATVEANGEVTTSTALTDLANGYVPRSAASSDGFNFWAVGGAGGVRFALGSASTSTELVAAPSSLNQVAIFEGQLYASTAAGAGVRIGKVGDGLPVSGPQTLTPLPGLPTTGNPNAFFLANLSPAVPGVDTLYVAYDDQGLRKFALVNGSWAARGTVGGDADDYRGLTAAVQGQSVTLYATRRAGELVRLVDASGYGGNLAGTPALIATADDNTAFRGVALAPRAADELQPDLTVSVSGPSTATVGAAYSYGLSVRNDGIVAATGVSVTFTLPPGVTYLAATGGAGFTPSASGGVVTFNGGSLGVGVQADLLVSVSAGAGGPLTLAPPAAPADPPNTLP